MAAVLIRMATALAIEIRAVVLVMLRSVTPKKGRLTTLASIMCRCAVVDDWSTSGRFVVDARCLRGLIIGR